MLICDQAPVSLEQDRMLDRLGDVMTFGCLEKCLECNGGQLVYQVAPRVKSFCVSVFLNLAKISRFFKNKMVPVPVLRGWNRFGRGGGLLSASVLCKIFLFHVAEWSRGQMPGRPVWVDQVSGGHYQPVPEALQGAPGVQGEIQLPVSHCHVCRNLYLKFVLTTKNTRRLTTVTCIFFCSKKNAAFCAPSIFANN